MGNADPDLGLVHPMNVALLLDTGKPLLFLPLGSQDISWSTARQTFFSDYSADMLQWDHRRLDCRRISDIN